MMMNLCTVNTRLFKACLSYLLEMSYSRCVSQFLEISSSTVTCAVSFEESKSRWRLWSRSALPVFIQRELTSCEMAKWAQCKKKILEDALARNLERKTGNIEEAAKE